VAVTGANGFLGSHIVRAMMRRGHAVTAVVRPGAERSFIERSRARILEVDYSDPDALAAALEGTDTVVHNAARARDTGSLDEFVRANVGLVERVFAAAARAGVAHVVHMSTNAVLGEEDEPRPKPEEGPLRPRLPYFLEWLVPSPMNHYRVTKAEGELRARALSQELGLRLTVLRPVWIFGPREFHSGPFTYCETISGGLPFFPGRRGNLFHAVYAPDVARAVCLAVDASLPSGTILNIGPKEAPLMSEFFGRFARAQGREPPRRVWKWILFPFVLLLEIGAKVIGRDPLLTRARLYMFYANNVYDTTRAERLLGFRADTPLDRAVTTTVRWWTANGYLPRRP
jgi:nucleoside-diphosphate-sugar epimerase